MYPQCYPQVGDKHCILTKNNEIVLKVMELYKKVRQAGKVFFFFFFFFLMYVRDM